MSVFNTWKWAEVIRHVYGYECVELGARFGAMTPLFRLRTLLSGRKLTNMPFNFFPDLVYGSEEELECLVEELTRQAALNQGATLELKVSHRLPAQVVARCNLTEQTPFLRSALDLGEGLEAAYHRNGKNFRSNLKRIRNRMTREGIVLAQASTEEDVQRFHRLLVRTYRDRHQMVCHPLELFLRLFSEGLARFYLAKDSALLAGGVVVIPDGLEWHYCWGATAPSHLPLGVSMALLDGALRDAVQVGATCFDFGTSSPQDAELLEFKRRWGCKTEPVFFYYHPPARVRPMPDLYSGHRRMRKLYRLLPVPFIERLLPWVVPQLG